ncbi:hypothetical protein TWF106_008843 [Orbilia oligospora]|uniref:Kinase n=1 Tax=Orbilia oligospora TaxID=2813651 RepID=A0A6G1LUJ7_ORBOL|nr:hypothetical protein TWF679_007509 [Orbilia oligospora]KAF3214998.1 hypothetical protein TWF106_008843 [Orbilia oligospora]KAF3232227.1 hypothetical protein TWF191_000006 [Orbilia oligospora]KAF3234895.1 hypothetical protein TWF192_001155 [Orbilia oligospora]
MSGNSNSPFIAPPLIKRFSHAAAGHEGVLRDESGALLIKPCLPKEVDFYQAAASHPEFAKWMPTFMGTLQLNSQTTASLGDKPGVPPVPTIAPALPSSDQGETSTRSDATTKKPLEISIVLSNLTYGFAKPCVLDVKLGAQLWDDEAPLEKRARLDEVSDKTTSRSLGMRIAGMKVWKGENKEYQIYDKNYGRQFTADNAVDGFKEFLFSGKLSEEQSKFIARRFADKVAAIQAVLENQESRMYSASLLFVYEGDIDALDQALQIEKEKDPSKGTLAEGEDDGDEDEDEEDDDESKPPPKKIEDLKIIDFAHATWTPGQGPDLNALHGVKSVLSLFRQLS